MLAHERRSSTSDLSHWLGPLSPAFAALAVAEEPAGERGFGAASPRDGVAQDFSPAHDNSGQAREAGLKLSATDQAGLKPCATDDGATHAADNAELRTLFHSLNNQLGVILTYAELLEAKAADEGQRARAVQVVTATLEALETAKALRRNMVGS